MREKHRSTALKMLAFFGVMAPVSIFSPPLWPVVAAAALVLPLRFVLSVAADFDEQDYGRFSPIVARLDDHGFVSAALLFAMAPAAYFFLDAGAGWESFGPFSFVIVESSVAVLTYFGVFYRKNFYFDRWHPVERFALLASGGLTLVSPAFIPMFTLLHRLIVNQFLHPDIRGFDWAHHRLPQTMVIIASAFVIAGMFVEFRPEMTAFLLLCGYASHYFKPGIAKITRNDTAYYIKNNNPVFLLLNAHRVGWLSFLEEDTVLKIWRYSDRFRPLMNVMVVLIEVSTVLLLFSRPLAVVIVLLVLSFHLFIFLSAGDDFWMWGVVNLAIISGIIFVGQPGVIFEDVRWFAMSIVFIAFSRGWMKPVGMGWLDSPYVEYYEFEADMEDGTTARLNTNVFRPYHGITQGTTGTFTYLGGNPKLTFSFGNINEEGLKENHPRLLKLLYEGPPGPEEAEELVEVLGEDRHDEGRTREMEEFLRRFIGNYTDSGAPRLIRYLSPPPGFYTAGISDRDSVRRVPELDRVRVYRVDGIWTVEGFTELDREEVASVHLHR